MFLDLWQPRPLIVLPIQELAAEEVQTMARLLGVSTTLSEAYRVGR